MKYQPLTLEEVRSVIEGRSVSYRIPVMLKFWTHIQRFGENIERAVKLLENYPEDIQNIPILMPGVFEGPQGDPDYRWIPYDDPYKDKKVGLDEKIAIDGWTKLDDILAKLPDPRKRNIFINPPASDGRYRLGSFGFCFFERHWLLRGMTNALMDYYTDPDSVHMLFRALTDFYKTVMELAKREQRLDGVFTTDDIGMQTGPFFSNDTFDEFFAPYYKELIEKAHSLDMHFWLHTCGNIQNFLPKFIDMKLDVIHPIQKYTMDEKAISDKYGKDICIWAGFDVQRIIPWGTPDEVRKEVRFMMDTYARPEGRLMFTAGNGVNGDCPIESLEALFDEAYGYGTKIMTQLRKS